MIRCKTIAKAVGYVRVSVNDGFGFAGSRLDAVVPAEELANEAFIVLREALRRTGKVRLGHPRPRPPSRPASPSPIPTGCYSRGRMSPRAG